MFFRAFHALPTSIEGADGQPVNALLGAVNLILQEVATFETRAVVVCFGAEAAHYRVALFDGYHAARPEIPGELVAQFAAAPAFLGAFGWTVARHDALEADDLLGAYARREAERGGRALVMTGDRDLFQCAGERVTILYVRTGRQGAERIDPEEVRRRYGVPPELVPDFIALRGDPSDGLPGAKGIGEKRAADILRRHGSLDAALEAAESEGPERNSLAAQADLLRAFKDIATLRQPKVKRPPDRSTDFAGGAAAARELGMGRLADRLAEKAAG